MFKPIYGVQPLPNWRVKRAHTGEVDRKLRIAMHGYIWYICVCVCVTYVHNPESKRKILQSQLLKKRGNGHHGKLAMDTLDPSMMKKMAADSKAKGKKPGSTRGLPG